MDSVRLDDLERWLAPSDAGRILGVSGQWVKQLCRRGQLRGVDTALGWLVAPESVEELRSARERDLAEKLENVTKATATPSRGRQRHARTLKSPSEEEVARLTLEAVRRARAEIAAERGDEELLPAPTPEEVRERRLRGRGAGGA